MSAGEWPEIERPPFNEHVKNPRLWYDFAKAAAVCKLALKFVHIWQLALLCQDRPTKSLQHTHRCRVETHWLPKYCNPHVLQQHQLSTALMILDVVICL